MIVYKATVCFILVFCCPIHLLLTNFAEKVQSNQEKGLTGPISIRTFRICVWLFVLWYLYLFLKYCYSYYVQYKIRYVSGWSAKTQTKGYCVCLAPELPYTDSSRQFWPDIDSHVAKESVNHTLGTALSHSQIPDKEESIQPQFNFCYHANSLSLNGNDWARIQGLMNLALAQRQRRDIVGPRSPLSPFKLTGLHVSNSVTQCRSVMGLALAQRQRRDFIGPRSLLVPVLL